MKASFKKILLFILFIYGFATQAQNDGLSKIEKNVPVIVAENFNNSFPDKDPVWFSRYQGRYSQELVYQAKFILDNRYCQSIYDINGNQIVFAATVEYKELPKDARDYMEEKYPNFPIVEALLVTDSKKEVTYEIGIYIDNQYVIQVFSKEGTFIKSTKA